jgi:hypothetical protein
MSSSVGFCIGFSFGEGQGAQAFGFARNHLSERAVQVVNAVMTEWLERQMASPARIVPRIAELVNVQREVTGKFFREDPTRSSRACPEPLFFAPVPAGRIERRSDSPAAPALARLSPYHERRHRERTSDELGVEPSAARLCPTRIGLAAQRLEALLRPRRAGSVSGTPG